MQGRNTGVGVDLGLIGLDAKVLVMIIKRQKPRKNSAI
jgi:hypothetical protein